MSYINYNPAIKKKFIGSKLWVRQSLLVFNKNDAPTSMNQKAQHVSKQTKSCFTCLVLSITQPKSKKAKQLIQTIVVESKVLSDMPLISLLSSSIPIKKKRAIAKLSTKVQYLNFLRACHLLYRSRSFLMNTCLSIYNALASASDPNLGQFPPMFKQLGLPLFEDIDPMMSALRSCFYRVVFSCS